MLIIKNATLLCPNKIIPNGALYIKDNIIADLGDSKLIEAKYPQAKTIDANSGLLMPGLTNCHTHLYSAFARGMSLKGKAPQNFTQILKSLWWRLDKALGAEDIYYSALVGLIECIKSGTTTIIDHHASPGFVTGSLSKIKQALTDVPLRAALCYEVSDRDGKAIANLGIKENETFIKDYTDHDLITALFGLHASFTVSDKTLKQCVAMAKDLDAGFHVHTAEDKADVIDAKKRYKTGVVERWHKHGMLGPKTILAHCIHISKKELRLITDTQTNVVHNPESNMNNAVGCADVMHMLAQGICVGLGTDGMTADMFLEAKFAHLIRKHVENNPRIGFVETGQLLFENNYKILSNFYPKPLGRIEKGALADLIILDYDAPTPLTHDNFLGHFLYGMNSGLVNTTIVNGQVLMRDRKVLGVDEGKIYQRARELAQKLWQRI